MIYSSKLLSSVIDEGSSFADQVFYRASNVCSASILHTELRTSTLVISKYGGVPGGGGLICWPAPRNSVCRTDNGNGTILQRVIWRRGAKHSASNLIWKRITATGEGGRQPPLPTLWERDRARRRIQVASARDSDKARPMSRGLAAKCVARDLARVTGQCIIEVQEFDDVSEDSNPEIQVSQQDHRVHLCDRQ